jgi:hypothetical protein
VGLVISPEAGGTATDYQWRDNGAGGVNYYNNGVPITRDQFQSGVRSQGDTQTDVGALEKWVAGNYSAAGASGAPAAATGPTSAQLKAAQDAAAGTAINAGYDGVIGAYDRQLGDIPGQIDAAGNIINSQYSAQKGSIDSAYGRGTANLDYAKNDLETKTNRSVRDLGKSIRQSFDSFSTMIGSGGGADSSAPGQLSYALQKANAQGRTDIYSKEADQMGEIALKRGDLDAQYQDNVKQLDAWKAQQVIQIGQQFQAARQQLELAKAGASKDKLIALASLNQNLVNQAVAALSGVEAQHQNAVAAINSRVQSLQAPGNPQALAATNFTPTTPTNPGAPGISINGGGAPAAGDSFAAGAVPYYRKLQEA